jgi:hypothetical protein
MRTQKDREGYRLYRLAGGLLDMYDGAEELERAKEAAREKACRGIEGKRQKENVAKAIEQNLADRERWDFKAVDAAYRLPISERDFHRRKRTYAEELTIKVGLLVGKNCDTI